MLSGYAIANPTYEWLDDSEPRFEAILRAVRLVGDHHDVVAVGQYWKAVFILPRHEFLDGGKTMPPEGRLPSAAKTLA